MDDALDPPSIDFPMEEASLFALSQAIDECFGEGFELDVTQLQFLSYYHCSCLFRDIPQTHGFFRFAGKVTPSSPLPTFSFNYGCIPKQSRFTEQVFMSAFERERVCEAHDITETIAIIFSEILGLMVGYSYTSEASVEGSTDYYEQATLQIAIACFELRLATRTATGITLEKSA